ncbi:translation initiation factor IF-3 [bacterium]|nr:translation initiation factor IF-3 [bacterium]
MSTATSFPEDEHQCESCGAIAYISGVAARHCPQCGELYELELDKDYGEFKGKRVRSTEFKEVRFRPKANEHDIQFKVKKAIGFLQNKHKVQVTILFRGRENAHIEEGKNVMQSIVAQLEDYGKVISMPSQQGRRLVCTIESK